MKVYFKRIYELSDEFQENLIDVNNFKTAKYLQITSRQESINGVLYDNVYTLEPLSFFEIKIREDTPTELLSSFIINCHFLESGLIFAGISKENRSIYVYNCTKNNVYIRENAVIGEVSND